VWDKQDVARATSLFRAARERDSTVRMFTEAEMGVYRFRYLRAGRADDALAVSRLVVEGYPASYRARDDLGTLLLQRGDTAGAMREFEIALERLLGADAANAALARDWSARLARLRGGDARPIDADLAQDRNWLRVPRDQPLGSPPSRSRRRA
jgi:tetratricopeptide (TPR) repeat protein